MMTIPIFASNPAIEAHVQEQLDELLLGLPTAVLLNVRDRIVIYAIGPEATAFTVNLARQEQDPPGTVLPDAYAVAPSFVFMKVNPARPELTRAALAHEVSHVFRCHHAATAHDRMICERDAERDAAAWLEFYGYDKDEEV